MMIRTKPHYPPPKIRSPTHFLAILRNLPEVSVILRKQYQPANPQGDTNEMKLYIYSNETKKHIATVTGSNNSACEAAAANHYSSNDYSSTYSPAFGFSGGLKENPRAKKIDADK